MRLYALWMIDGAGRVQGRQNLIGGSDAEAVETAQRLFMNCIGAECEVEVWSEDRLLHVERAPPMRLRH